MQLPPTEGSILGGLVQVFCRNGLTRSRTFRTITETTGPLCLGVLYRYILAKNKIHNWRTGLHGLPALPETTMRRWLLVQAAKNVHPRSQKLLEVAEQTLRWPRCFLAIAYLT